MIKYIIYEHGDAELFDKLDDLEEDIEAIDVKNNEYFIFTTEGNLIEQRVIKKNRQMLVKLIETKKPVYDQALLVLESMVSAGYEWAMDIYTAILEKKKAYKDNDNDN